MRLFKTRPFSGNRMANPKKMGRVSLFLGIAAILFLLIPTITIFLAIPCGVLAIEYEKRALRNGSPKSNLTLYGKNMGMAALVCISVELLLALILIIAWYIQT